VAESNKVTIYDGDDPSLPMWMVFEAQENSNGSQDLLNRLDQPVSALAAFNGSLAFGARSDIGVTGGLRLVRLLADDAFMFHPSDNVSSTGQYRGAISDRNGAKGFAGGHAASGPIISEQTNDVAMTVLPDAPIDPATGIQRVTIACLVAETEVAMADDSTKRLDQVVVGDVVKTLEGEHAVLNWWDQGIKDVVELEFDGGQKITCTSDHKIRTTEGWVEAGDLTDAHEVVGL